MIKYLILTFLLIVCSIIACDNDGDHIIYDYHAHIHQPSAAAKNLGETLFIDVEFESHTGENIEHINIKIRNSANTVVVYDKPSDAHIDQHVSVFEFQDQFVLSTANGITPGDWVIEASVWGADDDPDQLVSEAVTFQVRP